jgi:ABC-type oligopeptide transport system substrate-binding subunit
LRLRSWLLDQYQRHCIWKKNPDYYVRIGLAVIEIRLFRILSRLAQFKAGNICHLATQQDVVRQKDDDRLLLRQGSHLNTFVLQVQFETRHQGPARQAAVSLLIDRELMTDTIGGRDVFTKEGLDVPTRYHTMVGAGWDGYWIDPQDEKKFGPNAKYLITNIAEAKAPRAAGLASGFEITCTTTAVTSTDRHLNVANIAQHAVRAISVKQED